MADRTRPPQRLDGEDDWPPPMSIPEPDVLIGFHGLMSFAHHRGGFCEVGIHSTAPNHKLGIFVVEITDIFFTNLRMQSAASKPNIVYKYVGHAASFPEDVVRIEVSKPQTPGVSYYKYAIDAGRSDEWAIKGAEYDFRWIIDFENEELYKTQVKKKAGVFRPKLRIKAGVFATLLLTPRRFQFRTPYVESEPRPVGFFFGASIDLKANGFVAIKIGNQEVLLNKGKRYYVHIDNGCPRELCAYNPHSPIKEKRNDFHHYYDVVKGPDYDDECELVCVDCRRDEEPDEEGQAAEAPSLMEQRRSNVEELLELLGVILSDDDSPCGATGFGDSGGGVEQPP